MNLRVVTYNIHKCIGGVDRRYRPERTVETLARYAPDVIMLQEVDEGVPRSRGHRQVDLLGDALALEWRAFQRNVNLRTGFYGNAILSRFPLSGATDVDLSVPMKKRRQALVATVHLDGAPARSLRLVSLHLGLAGVERNMQLRRLLAHACMDPAHDGVAAIVAGDFNDVWGTLGPRNMVPAGFQAAASGFRTFPAAVPLRALDGVYYRGGLAVTHAFTARSRVSREASDHLPLVVDFSL